MKQNKFGELIFSESDVCDLLMQGRSLDTLQGMIVDHSVTLPKIDGMIDWIASLRRSHEETCSVDEFHSQQQKNWHMPEDYRTLDIAEHVLKLCNSQAELQRCGEELLLYQERNLFDLLRYLKYLVDIMQENNVIWGVGRGSSVSSYVLFKLGLHRIDSMFYNLDIREFLR